ncbi:MAG: EAL domain-containing protein [Wenzhouxiangellaceae bacterium]|nr:MAG: EAL domain-containing protein [Wenzhouxiangellaceae bacterium]
MDVTRGKRAEREAEHGRDLLRYIIEHNRAAVAVHDRDLNYIYVSQKYIDVFEIEDPGIIGKHHYEVFPDLPQKWRDVHQRVLQGEVVCAEDDPFVRADGRLDWSSWSCRPWFEADGSIGGLIVYTEIVTERKQVELDLREKTRALAESNSRLAQLAAVFTHAREGIIIADAKGDIIEVNQAFSRITGYARDEVLGRNPRFLSSGRHSPGFFAGMWQQLEERGYWSGEIWNKRKNGEMYPQQATISAVRDDQGQNIQYVGLLSDVSSEKHHARQLEYVSRYDTLTGLPNRALLTERLKRAMAECSRHDRTLALVLLDLDDFRRVNEAYGSAVGDRVLCEFAQRLRASLAGGDTAARLGGDELVVLLTDLAGEKQAVESLDRLLELARAAFNVVDVPLQLSASAGVSFFPQPGQGQVDADQLLRQADQAMYRAKQAGKDRIHYFNAEKDQAERGLHETLKRIEAGLKADEFALYYQPKVNMRTGQVLGAEALLRWRHPERGTLPPAQFLPLVEGQPLALELGDWVLRQALAQLAGWNEQGLRVTVSVNVFARQMLAPDFIAKLHDALQRCPGVEPEQLEIEVLETSALEDMARISALIEQCQALGVRCALDDFGTGYSSLTYLRRLPASILKIDQSFVRDMLDDPEDLAILHGILGLSRAFQREAVAEGVETVAHGDMLLDLGCELGQGYGIARPMPADTFPSWMAAWKPSCSWRGRTEKRPHQIEALFAAVEHRAWVSNLVAYVQGNVERPPETSARRCAFGDWLRKNAATLLSDSAELEQLRRTHERVQALATRVVTLKKNKKQKTAEATLEEVFACRDELLAILAAALAEQGQPAADVDQRV